LKAASFRGLVGPGQGAQGRFTSPASWVRGPLDRRPPADGLREVARRFLRAYAPATTEDLSRAVGRDR